jgi:enolase
MKIKEIKAREILSSNSYPTIETSVILENGVAGTASVPFGASAGKHEAFQLLDGDKDRYGGYGVLNAVNTVENTISPALSGCELKQKEIDAKLIELDGSERKEKLGGNTILSVSLASIRAKSVENKLPLFKQIKEEYELSYKSDGLPMPMAVMIEGGKHADKSTDFQEYIATVTGKMPVKEAVCAFVEIYLKLGKMLKESGYNINVGSEGAYAPFGIDSNYKPLEQIFQAIREAGYEEKVKISMDPAASEFYFDGKYVLKVENRSLSGSELVNYYEEMVNNFPIYSIEDGHDQDDWNSWKEMYDRFKGKLLIVGDDLTVTSKDRLRLAIEKDVINAIIIKPNQVGTLTETIDTIKIAKSENIKIVVSHRGGGETIDTFIIDLAAAVGADFVKVGPSRGERVVKYNRLMEIGEKLGL